MTVLLVVCAGIAVLASAFVTWTLCASGSWAEEAHEAETLKRLAAERARNEMNDRVRRLLRERTQ